MSELIRHNGIVTDADAQTVHVRIVQAGACASCKAKAMCTSAENQEKTIECQADGVQYHTGEKVEVMVEERLGWKAVWLAYILPFFIMILSLFVLNRLVHDEAVTGLVALCAAALYFALLALAGKRLQQTFSFHVRPLGQGTPVPTDTKKE